MAKPDPRNPMVKAIELIASRLTESMPDHDVPRKVQADMNGLRLKAEALDRVARTRSPLDTPAAHAMKVAKMARTFQAEANSVMNRAAKTLAHGVQDAYRRIEERVNLTPDAFAAEIRQAVRALPTQERTALVERFIHENRGPELAAILKAPLVLTGLSEAERAAYEKSLFETHAQAELAEVETLEGLWSSVTTVMRAADDMAREFTDPETIATIEADAAAAKEAEAAFNQPAE